MSTTGQTMSIGKFIGCTMLIIGSSIGAGILALPLVTAGPGVVASIITIFPFWILLTITGFLVIEANLALPKESCSYGSMAEKILGNSGKVFTWISYLFLLYSTVLMYMAGETSLIVNSIEMVTNYKVPSWLASTTFTLLLGAAVFWSTAVVDHFNRSFLSVKGFLLFATLALVLPQIDINTLIASHNTGQAKYLLAAAPVFITIFHYHFVVPSLRIYIGDKPTELKWIIFTGTTVSLVIYLLWVIANLGAIPPTGPNSFANFASLPGDPDLGDFITLAKSALNNKWITTCINSFFNISMTTSFLGVSLGLFDFLADGFRRPNTRLGRFQTAGLTFIPPFIFTIFYPKAFMLGMSYASSFIAILFIILPALMVYRLRKNPKLQSSYRTIFGNKITTIIIGILGVILCILPILKNLHLLPKY